MMLQSEERNRCISFCDDILPLIEEYKEDDSRYYFRYLYNSYIIWIGQLIEELQQKEAEFDATELVLTKREFRKYGMKLPELHLQEKLCRVRSSMQLSKH